MSTPNYTAAELRQCADAVEAQAAGKPVQQMHPDVRDGKWHMLGICGIVIDGDWRFRPAPEPTVIPWTRETLPPLPVEVRNKNSENRYTITSAQKEYLSLGGIGIIGYGELLHDFARPDGSPCGEVKA